MSDESLGRRRTAALVAAMVLLIASFVVVTLRCVSEGDNDRRQSGSDADTSSFGRSVDAVADDEAAAAAAVPAGEKAGTRDAGKAAAARRRGTRGGVEPSPAGEATCDAASRAAKEAARRSPYGNFTLMGEVEAHPGRGFGGSVAIDGDVAVIAAPGFKKDGVDCGAAYVFERHDGVWTQAQRFDPPRPDATGFAKRVGVSGGRIVVFGGRPTTGDEQAAFRSYVRDKEGRWNQEAEVALRDVGWDAVFHGKTAAIVVGDGIDVWELGDGGWRRTQTIPGSPDFGYCLSIAGATLVATGNEHEGERGKPVFVFRRGGGVYRREAVLHVTVAEAVYGALAENGDAFVSNAGMSGVRIDRRTPQGWKSETHAPKPWEPVESFHNSHPIAADGDLVLIASSPVFDEVAHEFIVLQRRTDAWYRTSLTPERDEGPSVGANGPAWDPNVALSGRAAVVSTIWDGEGSGRAWFFDVTDDDLARATKLESDAK